MTWNLVTSFQLITDWQITDVLPTGSYFQITHDNAPTGALYVIAQVELIDGSDKMRMCDSQVLAVDHKCVDIVKLVKPEYFTSRRLAIKRLPTPATVESELKRLLIPTILQPINTVRFVRENQWAVDIQVSDYVDATNVVDLTPIQVKLDTISTKLNNLSVNPNTSNSSSTSKTLTYQSDGDTNGACYWIGTNYGKEAWTNPHEAGRLIVSMSSFYDQDNNNPNALVNRNGDDGAATANTANSWIAIDLGAKNSLVCSYYSLRGNKYSPGFPRNWKFQGSKDFAGWVDLDTQNNNTLITANNWFSGTTSGSTGYRYFRVVQTGANAFGDNVLALSELELYGTLVINQ